MKKENERIEKIDNFESVFHDSLGIEWFERTMLEKERLIDMYKSILEYNKTKQ